MNLFYEIFQMDIEVSYRSSKNDKKVRSISKFEKLDWCYVSENPNSFKNPFMRKMVKTVKTQSPSYLKRCPMFGIASLVNFKQNLTNLSLFNLAPVGIYSSRWKFYDEPKNRTMKLEYQSNTEYEVHL